MQPRSTTATPSGKAPRAAGRSGPPAAARPSTCFANCTASSFRLRPPAALPQISKFQPGNRSKMAHITTHCAENGTHDGTYPPRSGTCRASHLPAPHLGSIGAKGWLAKGQPSPFLVTNEHWRVLKRRKWVIGEIVPIKAWHLQDTERDGSISTLPAIRGPNQGTSSWRAVQTRR